MRKQFWFFSLILILISHAALAFPIRISEAPGSNLSMLLSAIQGATKSISVNIYEFTEPEIADALINRIKDGVVVKILQEGQPVGGISAAAKAIRSRILAAMQTAPKKGNRYFEMKKGTTARRFHYDHGKYLLIDGKSLYVTSENFSPSGHPQPGSIGNRGWDVLIQNSAVAAEFAAIFDADTDASHGDIVSDFGRRGRRTASSDAGAAERSFNPYPTEAIVDGDAQKVQKVTSPDTSLSGLLSLIKSAQRTLDIEQMNFVMDWSKAGKKSPLFDAVVAAAKRGVKTRILLNDESAFGPAKDSKNVLAADEFNRLARKGGLPLEARIANLRAMHTTIIHNKGALSDNEKVLVSSINWNENSVTRNRETAVLLTSSEAYSFFLGFFDQDWTASRSSATSKNDPTEPEDQTDTDSEAPANCPEAVQVSARIGHLTLLPSTDPSFQALSESTFEANFLRDELNEDCILIEELKPNSTIQKFRRHVLEIRIGAQGQRYAQLEGYTSHGKHFSIRGTQAAGQSGTDWQGRYGSGLYDHSSTPPKRLGPSNLELTEPN